ncbi:MAG: zinc ribbon domain-containing protein [Bryobacterales bacterium]|nr:zinc ribbon domain-containing protein [Bryobacterales bacterium]
MPLYEYHCETCGTDFERLRPIREADSPTQCPKCESEEVRRLLSAFMTRSGGGCGPGGGGGRGRFT